MRSLKAIVAGTILIIVVILFLQLAYIFVAVGYNTLAKDYPFLNDITDYFRYVIGIPIFVATMFLGGYITASVAHFTAIKKTLWHCFVVGLITAGGMIYPTLENAEVTNTGIFIIILSLLATPAGGWYWQKSRTNYT